MWSVRRLSDNTLHEFYKFDEAYIQAKLWNGLPLRMIYKPNKRFIHLNIKPEKV